MNKSILAIAVAATMAAPAAIAAPTVYGNIHLSINAADNDIPDADNNIKISSNTSSLGVKGSEDLGDGLKAIYKAEWEIDISEDPTVDPGNISGTNKGGTGALTGRDQFVGLKAGWGALKIGTMSSNYKQMGGKVDAFYRTPIEGRGLIATQSKLHSGRGNINGRQTNTLQYVSPKMAGIQLVANTTFTGNNDETSGLGLRWSNKAFLVYGDYISGPTDDVLTCTAPACSTESAYKLGGKWSGKAFSLALQYEDAQDRIGADYVHTQATWNINKNNMVGLTYGMQDRKEAAGAADNDSTGIGVAYNHNLSKMTNVYVAYGMKDEDAENADASMLAFGIRKKF